VAYEKRKLFQTRLYQDIISHALTVSVFVFVDEFQMRRLIWFAEMKKRVAQFVVNDYQAVYPKISPTKNYEIM
jgi:hypothetical protein